MQVSCYLQEFKLLSAWAVQQQCCPRVLACLLIAQREHVRQQSRAEQSANACTCHEGASLRLDLLGLVGE